jgi:hypothetical protein
MMAQKQVSYCPELSQPGLALSRPLTSLSLKDGVVREKDPTMMPRNFGVPLKAWRLARLQVGEFFCSRDPQISHWLCAATDQTL